MLAHTPKLHSRSFTPRPHPLLDKGAHDLLGTLGAAHEWYHLRVRLFGVTYPSWAGASQHRQFTVGISWGRFSLKKFSHMFG